MIIYQASKKEFLYNTLREDIEDIMLRHVRHAGVAGGVRRHDKLPAPRFIQIDTGVRRGLRQHELRQILRKWPDIDASIDISIQQSEECLRKRV